MTNLKTSIYKDYDKKVQEYMANVIDCLEQDYKSIPSSWRVSLDLIADNYDVYLKAKNDVMRDGIYSRDKRGNISINPSLKIMNTSQDKITKLLSAFALTPLSKSKMKNLETDGDLYEDLIE